MQDAAHQLRRALERCRSGLLLVVTGAGVSRASGIPTFRGSEPDAVWRRDDVELATRECFLRDPVRQWSWYLRRFRAADAARPNPAHHALVELERWQIGRGGDFLLVTQNIDTLHEQAGSERLIKVHGTADRLRCSRHGCLHAAPNGSLPRGPEQVARFDRDPRPENLPTCPACGALLRAHVLFFDEFYQEHRDYRFEETLDATHKAELTLFVGTSFSVGITELALRGARRHATAVWSIDPGAGAPPAPGVELLRHPAEELLPEVMRALVGSGAEVPLEDGA